MFSNNYIEAKDKFLQTAKFSGYQLAKYIMPTKTGPNGEELSTDVAFYLTPETKKILIVNSGIHGVEGFYGSALQSLWLSKNNITDLPKEIGIVFIHACNPYGFAYQERVDQSEIDEHGVNHRVDPNRNFIDFSKPLPQNPGYTQELEDLLIPHTWNVWDKLFSTTRLLMKFLQDKIGNTHINFLNPTMGGQYHSPTGFSYGGNHPSWTNEVFNKIKHDIINQVSSDEIVFIDLHTGIGKPGTCEAYSLLSEESENHTRTKEWLKNIVNTIPAPYETMGSVAVSILKSFPEKKVTSFALECGTKSGLTVLNSLRSKNWLDKYGDKNSPRAAEINKDLKDAFYPNNDKWKMMVTEVTMKIFEKVMTELSPKNSMEVPVENKRKYNNTHYNTHLLFVPRPMKMTKEDDSLNQEFNSVRHNP